MPDHRRAELAKIHLGAKQLGLDDDTYRDLLWTVARVRSAGNLDEAGRRKVIEHLRSRGVKFDAPKRSGRRPHNYNRLPAYIEKVEALLADMGLSWAYADRIAQNITGGKGRPGREPGVERLAWVKRDEHWRAIIAALSVEQEKRGLHAAILKLLEQAGKDLNYIDQLFPDDKAPTNWHRNRRLMRTILNHLRPLVPDEGEAQWTP